MVMTETEEVDNSPASSRPPCPFKELFRSSLIFMPRHIRQEFLDMWVNTDLGDLVRDMVNEVNDEEDEDDITIEPSSSDDEIMDDEMDTDEEKTP